VPGTVTTLGPYLAGNTTRKMHTCHAIASTTARSARRVHASVRRSAGRNNGDPAPLRERRPRGWDLEM